MYVKIEGEQELKRKLGKLEDSLSPEKLNSLYKKAADTVRDAIKDRAPTGPTGNLKRSPISRVYQHPHVIAAIAGIDRKIAPHAHLIEFGTVRMQAHPFFRPAWDETRDKAEKMLREGEKKLVEDSIR